MGSRYLTELANWCHQAGFVVHEEPGWQTRARSSGGFDGNRPWCIMWHHTASSTSPQNDVNYMCHNPSNSNRPTANILLDRNGEVWIMAAGATNTNGKGKSLVMSLGTVPTDSMNTHALGVEAANNGVGEPWPQKQIDGYFKLNNLLALKLGLRVDDLSTHQFYAPDRKIDPATAAAVQGPWRPTSVTSSGTWSVDDVRGEAWNRMQTNSYTVKAGDTMSSIAKAHGVTLDALLAANPQVTDPNKIYPGQVLNIPTGPLPPDPTPPDPTPPDPTPPDPTPPPSNGGYDWMASLPTLKKGSTGPYVERMQHLLAAAGFMDPGNVNNYDGVWGNGTDNAKRNFDNAHGLASSNTDCGPKSWESLMTGKKW